MLNPIIDNEYYRLNAVNRFKQLDKEIQSDLDAIVNLAAQICKTPVSLITLLDRDKNWFKARKGTDVDCTDREIAFCNHTIKQNQLLMVKDTTADERFAQNPLVAGAPFIRFYAGATLVTKDGFALGSLCVLDVEPRELTNEQQETLRTLSKQVINLMELSWSLQVLQQKHTETERQKRIIEESEIKLNAMFNSSKDTHVLVSPDLQVLAFNKAAAVFVREVYKKKIAAGKSILEYIDKPDVEPLQRHFTTAFNGKAVRLEWLMRAGTPQERWKELHLLPIKNAEKEIIGVALNSTDVTERKLQQDQINIQNAALTRIAIIQSHELRRPVASLLGIMSLIKLEKLNKNFDYFDMLEHTINELDGKIRGIVQDSENTLNSPLSIVA